MFTQTVDTIIIGGGLSGMYAAYLLSKKNISFVVLEARERIGG
ncbi:NAD(P)-binding protein [Desulfobacula sp.]|nr:NAD(P)-binding protein [Desulfobacula sp.]